MKRPDTVSLLIVALWIGAILLLAGCNIIPGALRGGSATTQLGGKSAPTTAGLTQPENPAAVSSQQVARDETRQEVVPVATVRITETPQADGKVVRVTEQFAPQVLTSTVKEQTKTEVGAAQKDNAREMGAKLAALRPVQFAGIAALALACAMFHPVVRVALGGGKMLQVYVGAAGILLIFLPTIIVGNEHIILIGAVVLGAAAWGINRLGHKEGQLDALKDGK